MQLYDYQEAIIRQAIQLYSTGNYVYIQMPTGAGKTITSTHLIERLGITKVLWVVGSVELVEQIKGVVPSYIDVMTWHYVGRHVEIASNYDMLVIDEVHYGGSANNKKKVFFTEILKVFAQKKKLYISASPWDLRYDLLGDIKDRVCSYYIDEAFNAGNIPNLEMRQLRVGKQEDVASIEKQCKSSIETLEKLDEISLKKFLDKNKINVELFDQIQSVIKNRIDFLIKEYQQSYLETQAILFTPNILSLKYACMKLQERGISFSCVHSEISQDDISFDLIRFKTNKFQIMVACNMLNLGFDMPNLSLVLDSCFSKYNTRRNYQKIGRLLRKYPEKTLVKYIYTKDMYDTKQDDGDVVLDIMTLLYCDRSYIKRVHKEYLPKDFKTGKEATFSQALLLLGGFNNGYARFSEIAHNSRLNESKKTLLEMAAKGEKRPSTRSTDIEEKRLARTLYFLLSNKYKDEEFKNKIKVLAPHWLNYDLVRYKKQELLKMAKEGQDRPTKASKSLYRALGKYTQKTSSSYDRYFTTKLHEIAPHWFVTISDKVNLKKQRIIELALEGHYKPTHRDKNSVLKILGNALKDYTSKSKKTFDPEFTKKLHEIAPPLVYICA